MNKGNHNNDGVHRMSSRDFSRVLQGFSWRCAAMWFFCLFFCLGASSCRRAVEKARDKIRVERIEWGAMHGTSGCDVVLQVRNDTGYKLSLESASIDLFYGSSRVVTLVLQEPVEVPRRCVQRVVTRWKWRIADPLALYALFRRVQRDDLSGIAVSYAAAGRGGPAPFAVAREGVPLHEVLESFGSEAQEVLDYFKLR